MGAVWLLSQADVLRAAGLVVVEEPGWRTRSRSTGGLEQLLAISVHHDAVPPGVSTERRQAYQMVNAPGRPIGGLHVEKFGVWHVNAAGATNTQGRGPARRMSKGVIPADRANLFVLSIEAENDGVGEPWPEVMQESYVIGVAALCAAYGLLPSDVFSHAEGAPGRKIDPAGPSRFATGRNTWNMDVFREAVTAVDLNPAPPPPPTQLLPEPIPEIEEPEMLVILHGRTDWRLLTGGRLVVISAELASNLMVHGGLKRVGVPNADWPAFVSQFDAPVKR